MTLILTQLTHAYAYNYLELFRQASEKHQVPLPILLAVASRESGIGTSRQFVDYKGDYGNGKGLMQIDQRWHPEFTSKYAPNDHAANINYGASLLAQNYKTFGKWPEAIAAYNAGAGNVRKAIRENQDIDFYTTGKDYSKDVLQRAALIESLINNPVKAIAYNWKFWAGIGFIIVLAYHFRR